MCVFLSNKLPCFKIPQLTHGFELADQFLLGPLGPLFLVCIDGTQNRSTWFPTILDRWNIQIVDEHNIRVLWGNQREQDGYTNARNKSLICKDED